MGSRHDNGKLQEFWVGVQTMDEIISCCTFCSDVEQLNFQHFGANEKAL